VSANAGGFTAFYTRTCRSLIVCEGQELAESARLVVAYISHH